MKREYTDAEREFLKQPSKKLNKDNFGYIFIAPFFIAYLIFGLYPAVSTLMLAFFQYDNVVGQTSNFVGLQYVGRAFVDPKVWWGIFHALEIWLYGTILTLGTALFIAAVFTYVKVRFANFFKSSFFIPAVVSTAAIATLLRLFMAYPGGLFNLVLLKFNFIDAPVVFLDNENFTFIIVIIVGWWLGFGSNTITVGAGMTSISEEIYEASKMDGANFTKIFTRITVPLMRPILVYMFLTSLIWGIQTFDIPFMLGGSASGGATGRLQTIAMYVYAQAFQSGNVGYGAAVSLILFVVILLLSAVTLRVLRVKDGE